MRIGEECPYITPCGWCSRQEKPCEKRNRRKRNEPIPEMTEEQARALGYITEEELLQSLAAAQSVE